MTKRALAAFLIAIVPVVALVVTRSGKEDTRPSQTVEDCLLVAVGGEIGVEEECLGEVFAHHWSNGTLGELTPFTDKYENTSLAFENACHDAAHETGRVRARAGGDVAEYVRTTPYGLGKRCTAGLVHGLFDELSLTEDPVASWEELVTACGEVMAAASKQRDMDNGCAEGMGHLLWNAQVGTDKVPALCTLFEYRLAVVTCVVSYFMEMYFPRREFMLHDPPSSRMQDAEWGSLCSEFREVEQYAGEGCAAAAAYVWLRTSPQQEVLASVNDRRDPVEVRADNAIRLLDLLRSKCSLFPLADERGACILQALALPGDVLGVDEVFEQFCREPAGMHEIYCAELVKIDS